MKNWRRKITSVLLAFVMAAVLLPVMTINANAATTYEWNNTWRYALTGDTGSTGAPEYWSGYAIVTQDCTYQRPTSGSFKLDNTKRAGFKVCNDLIIYIPAGITLTVIGSNTKTNSSTNIHYPAAAGIYLPSGLSLWIVGEGNLYVRGGSGKKTGDGGGAGIGGYAGINGVNGSNGGNIYIASTIHADVAGGSGYSGGSNGPAYGGGGAGAGGSNGASGTIVTNFAAGLGYDSSNIVFDSQGGTEIAGQNNVHFGATLNKISKPTRKGYNFKGFYSEPNGAGVQVYDNAGNPTRVYDLAPVETRTLYAYWEPWNMTVNFDKNGGTGGTRSITATYDSDMPEIELPTKNGYTFDGYYDWAGTNKYYNADGSSAKTWDNWGAAEQNLYAHWIENEATLTYDANGHGTAPEAVTMKYTVATNAADSITGVTGYTFSDWNTKADGTGTSYAAGTMVKDVNTNPTATTLYAQWTPNTYTIAYDANSGNDDAPVSEAGCIYNTSYNLSSDVPTKTGYTFKEWNTTANGNGAAYNAGASVTNLESENGATVTLYAQWTANEYTVTLNNGGGSGDASLTATYDAVLPNVTVPTWENHVFCGYYTEAGGKGTQYIDKNGNGVKAWDLTTETTLYAFWKESAKIESMDLTLGGDIGMRYHVAVNDPELQKSGTMTVSIGGKKASETTVPYSEAPKDKSGAILFPFNVSSIQMAEPVKVKFKGKDGKVIAEDAKSVEDYYNLVKDSSASADQKEMVRSLVNYGYYAQQALSKTGKWSLGTDYAASTQHGDLTSTANDLKAYKPVISGTGTNVKDIQISLLLDNKTTLCIYILTTDKTTPEVTVNGVTANPTADATAGWWLVKIEDIDALNLSTMYTLNVNGYTVYLSALSYASVTSDSDTIDAMRAMLDYYHAALKANGKKVLTSATVEHSEYDYTGNNIEPALTVKAGEETVTNYKVEWNGNLKDAGTYTGLVTHKDYVGGVTVTVTIRPKTVTAPTANPDLTYNGSEQTGVGGSEPENTAKNAATGSNATPNDVGYTLTGNTATNAGEYTAIATLKENRCWCDGSTDPKEIKWTIKKKPIEKPEYNINNNITYTGSEQTGVTVTENEGYTISGTTKATSAGEYKATITLNSNYCWSDNSTDSIEIKWNIAKNKITVPTANTGFVYDGNEKIGISSVAENAGYTLSGTTKATNAGNYTATANLTDSVNTCWNDDTTSSKELQWTIAKKIIDVPSYEVKDNLTYNGQEQTGVIAGTNSAHTLTGNTGTNAGNYTAKLTLTDTNNTCWNDNTTNVKAISWSIDKATPTVVDEVNVTYYPNGKNAIFSGSMNVPGTFNYDPSSGITTFNPTDTQNYNTVSVEATVTIDNTAVSPNMSFSGN